jgi:hypothetical protein
MTPSTTALPSTRPSAAVLRNRGVPVRVHATQVAPGGDLDTGPRWERVMTSENEDAAPVYETLHVRFTTLDLAEIEEKWGGIEDWNKALNGDRPNVTVIDTFAILWHMPRERAGIAMLDAALDEYAAALGGAFLLANGGEVDAVVRVLASRITVTGTKRKIQGMAVGAQLDEEQRLVSEAETALEEYQTEQTKPEPAKKTSRRRTSTGPSGSGTGSVPVEASRSSGG